MSCSDECAECVLAIVQPHYLVKLAVAGAVVITIIFFYKGLAKVISFANELICNPI